MRIVKPEVRECGKGMHDEGIRYILKEFVLFIFLLTVGFLVLAMNCLFRLNGRLTGLIQVIVSFAIIFSYITYWRCHDRRKRIHEEYLRKNL